MISEVQKEKKIPPRPGILANPTSPLHVYVSGFKLFSKDMSELSKVSLAPDTEFNLALDQYFADHGEERLGKNFYKVMMSKRPKMQLSQDEVVGGRKLFGETVNSSLAVEDIQI
jgi:hypothetical protein